MEVWETWAVMYCHGEGHLHLLGTKKDDNGHDRYHLFLKSCINITVASINRALLPA